MYKSYNSVEKELSLTKSKFYLKQQNHDFVNSDIAEDLRKFFEEDFLKSDYVDKYINYLKDCFKNNGNKSYESLRVADSEVLKVNLSGLWFYNIRVLITYDGDTRNIEKLKTTWKETPKDADGFKKFTYNDGGEEMTDGEYLTILVFPVPSKNATWKIYSDKFSDRNDGREFYFRLQLKQAPGLYYSSKAGEPVLILHNDITKITFEKKQTQISITDSNARINGNKIPLNLLSILPYVYFTSDIDGKSDENYFLHIASLRDDTITNAITDKYGMLKRPNEQTVEKFNKSHVLDNLQRDISEIDGIEALTNVVGYELSRDSGSLKAGTLVTEENKSMLDTSKPIYVKCAPPIGVNIHETELPIRCMAQAVLYNKEFEGTTIAQLQVKGKVSEDGYNFILEPQEITKCLQRILLDSGVDCVSTFNGNIYLERPIFVTKSVASNTFYTLLNIISLLKSIDAQEENTKFHLLDLRSSFNRYVYTPRMIVEDSLNRTWDNLFRLYKNKIANHGLVYASSLREILKDDTLVENPIGVMNKCVIQNMRKDMYKNNLIDYVTTKAMINPIQFVSCLRQVDIKTKDSNSVSFEDRQLHPAMLGRLDMFEVPLGQKLGTTTHLTTGCIIGKNGELNVRYRKIINGQITDQFVDLKSIEEHNYVISSMSDLDIDDDGRVLNKRKVFAKVQSIYNKWNVDIELVDPSEVQLVSCSPDSDFSWSVSCIPFVSNNDSARVTYGVSQLKQAKSIIVREAPIVRTNAWKIIPKVQDLFSTVRTISNTKFCIPQINQSDHSLNIQYHKGVYDITDSAYSGVESSMIKDGCVCVGRNALVAYISDGSTYEDAVHVSRDFSDKLISYRIDDYASEKVVKRVQRDENSINSFPTTPPIYSRYMLRRCLQYGESLCKINDTGKNIIFKSKNEGLILRVSHKSKLLSKDTSINKLYEHSINYEVLKISRLQTGDKLSNRHANKGVLSYSSPDYYLGELSNGKKIDVIYNVMGVISRMNLGQIYEAKLGLIGMVLGININVNVISCITDAEIRELLKRCHKLVNSGDNFDTEVNTWSDISSELVEELKKNKIRIQSWANTFDEDGCVYVKGTNTKVLIGVMYVNKLTQESETKMGVRGGVLSNEGYVGKTKEPVQGAKRNGGQKIGSMEVDAYMAYGADNLLRKLYNERSGNVKQRMNYIQRVLNYDFHNILKKTKDLLDARGSVIEFVCTMKALGIDITSMSDCSLDKILECNKDNTNIREHFMFGVKDIEQDNGLTTASVIASSKNPQILEIENYLRSQGEDWNEVKKMPSPIGGTYGEKIQEAITLYEMENRNQALTQPKDLIIHFRNNAASWSMMEDMYNVRMMKIKALKEMSESEFTGVQQTDFDVEPIIKKEEQRAEKISKEVGSMDLIGTYELEDLFGA